MKKLETLIIQFIIFFLLVAYSTPIIAQVCEGDFNLSSQAQVDAFNCTELRGGLIISGDDITNLNNLSGLIRVGRLSIVDNPNLMTLEGLSGLRAIDDFLGIALNHALTDLKGLSSLESVGGLAVSTNNGITTVDGLLSLKEINDGGLAITDNPLLNDISGVNSIQSIDGVVYVTNNGSLSSIQGFNNLLTLTEVWIDGNPKLLDINGFRSLQSTTKLSIQRNNTLINIQGFLGLKNVDAIEINENKNLSKVEAFSSLRSVSGNVLLTFNDELSNLSGFSSLDSIQGELRIIAAYKLTDLNGLSSLKYAGSISLIGNNSLTNINGLSSLSEIGEGKGNPMPSTIRYSLEIRSNDLLINLDGLSALKKTRGPIRIENNSSLVTIDGFSSLSEINGVLHIGFNPSLKSLNGFKVLTKFSGFLSDGECGLNIERNTSLAEFAGLSSLRTMEGGFPSLLISSNDLLPDINGLSNLISMTGVRATISIHHNAALRNLDGLSALSTVTGNDLELLVHNNATLENINGLASLGAGVTGTPLFIIVRQNPTLGRCDGLLPYFLTLGVDEVLRLNSIARIQINENGAGCTVEDIFAADSIIVKICDGEVVLSHQSQVDAFNCAEVKGNLKITGNDITNLNGLSSLRKVSGNLLIQENLNLRGLDGLSSIESIGGYLTILNNTALQNINGLSSLTSVEVINVIGNVNLTNLDGFVSVTHLKDGIYISDNSSLTDISGAPSLLSTGAFIVEKNNELKRISGFNNLITAGEITISGNPSLVEIVGFSSLVTIESEFSGFHQGDLTIEGNNVLSNIQSFPALMRVKNIHISGNGMLSVLDPFSSLKSVAGDMILAGNSELSTINGFNHVDSIAGVLRIENNYKLTDLNAFSSLKSAGLMIIGDNFSLTNLNGFTSLKKLFDGTFNGGELIIRFNSSLNTINGFNGLTDVSGIGVDNNPKLIGIKGFNSLKTIKNPFGDVHGTPGYLSITENGILNNLQGFSGLTFVGGLRIFGNNSLQNLDGFANLTKIGVGFGLEISNNALLENIDGLSSLNDVDSGPGSALYVNVTQNPSLVQCCGLRPLLEHLGVTSLNDFVNISQNGGGCTLEDILACGSQRISGFTLINNKTHAVIQNFQDEMTIDLADPKFSYLMLQANTAPQQVGSVEFIFDGRITHTENGFPYQFILPGLTPGTHTARVEVYSKGQTQGVKGVGRTATFKVINSATIISFDVVNQSRQTLMHLHDGDKINIKDPAFKTFLFVANTVPTFVSKVEFFLNNRLVAVENGFPYEVYGNRSPGDYTLEAIPYIKIRGNQYVAGTSLKISFKVVSEDPGSSSQHVMNELSNEESLMKVGESLGVTIFPVPVDSELYIKIDDAAGKDPVITIRTIYGLTVYQDSYSKSQSINTLHLQAGVYYLQVVGHGGFQKVIRFIKK